MSAPQAAGSCELEVGWGGWCAPVSASPTMAYYHRRIPTILGGLPGLQVPGTLTFRECPLGGEAPQQGPCSHSDGQVAGLTSDLLSRRGHGGGHKGLEVQGREGLGLAERGSTSPLSSLPPRTPHRESEHLQLQNGVLGDWPFAGLTGPASPALVRPGPEQISASLVGGCVSWAAADKALSQGVSQATPRFQQLDLWPPATTCCFPRRKQGRQVIEMEEEMQTESRGGSVDRGAEAKPELREGQMWEDSGPPPHTSLPLPADGRAEPGTAPLPDPVPQSHFHSSLHLLTSGNGTSLHPPPSAPCPGGSALGQAPSTDEKLVP